jgi:hypothetical protein
MELQHVNVKLHIPANGAEPDLTPLIPVFHGWIQGQVFGDLLLDVADYRHVPAGPGILVIGLDGDYSVDHADNRLGVRYNRKMPLAGSNQDRLRQAARAALAAAQRLESDPTVGGKFSFGGREVELSINDRLLAPNSEATREAAKPELDAFFRKLFKGSEFSLSFGSDPRRLFTVSAVAAKPFTTSELLSNLNA